MRQSKSLPLVTAMKAWFETQLTHIPPRDGLADAIRYALTRWDILCRFLDGGRIELDNSTVKRAIRPVTMHGSLCAPSLSTWEHWKRVRVSNATRATFSGHRHFDRLRRQVISANLVRRSGNNLLGGKDAGFNKAA